jgi:hypothetical protein
VSAAGSPAPTYATTYQRTFPTTGAVLPGLPPGFAFNATTGVLSWPSYLSASDYGTFNVIVYASNTGGTSTTSFTLTVLLPPSITSANSATYTAGAGGSFTVTSTGYVAPTLNAVGLPAGVTFVQTTQNNSTASSTGVLTVSPSTAIGNYTITFTSTNLSNAASPGNPITASQTFTLHIVGLAPTFTSINHATVTAGGTPFTVTAAGYPAPTFSTVPASLPTGITLNPTTGVLSVAAGTAAQTDTFNIIASNGVVPNATQTFTLTVTTPLSAPVFGPVVGTPHAHVGVAGSFTVSATGNPTPTLSVTSTPGLPLGFSFNASTGVLSWVSYISASSVGTYNLVFHATNSQGSATLPVTLTVTNPELLAGPANTNPKAPALTQAQLNPIVSAAIQIWANTGLSKVQVALLKSTVVSIGDLSSIGELGDTSADGKITIDATADGDGWYVSTSNDGFKAIAGINELIAATGPAATEVDLLTVVLHELGHILGYADLNPALYPDALMCQTLGVGVRRLP